MKKCDTNIDNINIDNINTYGVNIDGADTYDTNTKLYIKALRGKGSIPNICFISDQLKLSNIIKVNLYCKIVKNVNNCIWFDLFIHNIEYLENI